MDDSEKDLVESMEEKLVSSLLWLSRHRRVHCPNGDWLVGEVTKNNVRSADERFVSLTLRINSRASIVK